MLRAQAALHGFDSMRIMSKVDQTSQRPERMVSVLLTFIVLTASFNDDMEYGRFFRSQPDFYADLLAGRGQAPAQYRVAILHLAQFMGDHSPLAMRHWISVMGLFSAFVAVFTSFYLLRRSTLWQTASETRRWFAGLGFAFLTEYYLNWIAWYQRPETLPTVMLVSLVVLLITVPLPLPSTLRTITTATLLIALAALQGLVRADVALGVHAGILLFCLSRTNPGLTLSRWPQTLTSFLAGGVAFAIQYHLIHDVFPQARYIDTPMFQLLLNIKSPMEWPAFILFMMPVLWTFFRLFAAKADVEPAAHAVAFAAVVYFGLWMTFGRMEEVRIFMPMALALMPTTVTLAVQRFLPSPTATPATA
jgi:hypothetical protein